jgi:hypothetical protein
MPSRCTSAARSGPSPCRTGPTILGKAESLEALLILLHAVGYILIAVAIYKVAFPRKPQDY